MADDPLSPMIKDTYLALADLLDNLSSQGWDTPSLCDGWRIRHVVAHITMPSRYTETEFMAELQEDDFDFDRLSNRLAVRDAALATDELVRSLRDRRLHDWTPPGGGAHGALNHAVVHSLDITVALDQPSVAGDGALCAVLEDLTAGGTHARFGIDIDGRLLRATDIEWCCGAGAELAGPASDLVLQLCGRTVVPSRSTGEPLKRSS